MGNKTEGGKETENDTKTSERSKGVRSTLNFYGSVGYAGNGVGGYPSIVYG